MQENGIRPSLYVRAADVQQAHIEHYQRAAGRAGSTASGSGEPRQSAPVELSYEELMITHSIGEAGLEA